MRIRTLAVVSVLLPALAFAQAGKEAGLPSLAPLIESVKSAVVNVDVQARKTTQGSEDSAPDDEAIERFFGSRRGGPKSQREQLRQGAGSGFIVDARGLVLTNNHVVDGAVIIRVRLDDGRSFDGEVLGRDPLTDLALIKLKGDLKSLPVVRLGDSAAMRVGDWAVAIGNPFGLASSVSLGIVSALDPVTPALHGQVAVAIDHRGHDHRAARVDDFGALQVGQVIRTDPCDLPVVDRETDARAQRCGRAVSKSCVV